MVGGEEQELKKHNNGLHKTTKCGLQEKTSSGRDRIILRILGANK